MLRYNFHLACAKGDVQAIRALRPKLALPPSKEDLVAAIDSPKALGVLMEEHFFMPGDLAEVLRLALGRRLWRAANILYRPQDWLSPPEFVVCRCYHCEIPSRPFRKKIRSRGIEPIPTLFDHAARQLVINWDKGAHIPQQQVEWMIAQFLVRNGQRVESGDFAAWFRPLAQAISQRDREVVYSNLPEIPEVIHGAMAILGIPHVTILSLGEPRRVNATLGSWSWASLNSRGYSHTPKK